jgi:hypothetical protein
VSDGLAVLPNSIFLSSTVRVVLFIVVVVPPTVRLPVMSILPVALIATPAAGPLMSILGSDEDPETSKLPVMIAGFRFTGKVDISPMINFVI